MMGCMDVVQTKPSEFVGRPVAAALTIGLAALFPLVRLRVRTRRFSLSFY